MIHAEHIAGAVGAAVGTNANVREVWHYGSSLRDDYQAGESDIDLLVVVDDACSFSEQREIVRTVQQSIPDAEFTVLRESEVLLGVHPGWSSHYYRNVRMSGRQILGAQSKLPLRQPSFGEATTRVVELTQRCRLVRLNASKQDEQHFWLRKYQHWVPLCLMELLDLHGLPEYRLKHAHSSFEEAFAEFHPTVVYPYPDLESAHSFLEQLSAWLPAHRDLFTVNPAGVEQPLMTVITALGRAEYEYLHQCRDSLMPLSFVTRDGLRHIQWIVVIDGDVADVEQVRAACQGETSESLRVHVLRSTTHTGPSRARNRALVHARGRWLLTVDSDDTIDPDGMIALLDAVRDEDDAAWGAGRCPHTDKQGHLTWAGPPDPFTPGPIPRGAFWTWKLRTGDLPFLCTATIAATTAVRSVGGWPTDARNRAEDTAMWAVLSSEYPGVWVPRDVYYYRRHAASLTAAAGFRVYDEGLEAIAAMVKHRSTVFTSTDV